MSVGVFHKVAFTGVGSLGGVRLRGIQAAHALGVPFVELRDIAAYRFETLILVKYHKGHATELRSRCDRLIYDPLDCWSSLKEWRLAAPLDFWKSRRREIGFDDIIGTSPACVATMETALPGVRVHHAPHHCDPIIKPSWYDPEGPIVYAGGHRFIESQEKEIIAAATKLGRALIVDFNRACERSLRGASLALHLRLSPEDTLLNRFCKPQIKAENAAAAGLPILATDHPCIRTLRPEATFVDERLSWADNLARGLSSEPLKNAVRIGNHADIMARIISGRFDTDSYALLQSER